MSPLVIHRTESIRQLSVVTISVKLIPLHNDHFRLRLHYHFNQQMALSSVNNCVVKILQNLSNGIVMAGACHLKKQSAQGTPRAKN